MSYYGDIVKAGYALLRHHDQTFAVDYRMVGFACRIGGPDYGFGQGYDQNGVMRGITPNWPDATETGDTHGDLTNWGMWQISKQPVLPMGAQTRPIPGWAQVWASTTVPPPTTPGQPAPPPPIAFDALTLWGSSSAPFSGSPFTDDLTGYVLLSAAATAVETDAGLQLADSALTEGWSVNFPTLANPPTTQEKPPSAPGTVSKPPAPTVTVQPTFSAQWDPDTRFQVKTLKLPPGISGVPAKTGGIVVTGTNEYSQEDLFIPCMPNSLVVPHENGLATTGTIFSDLQADNSLDKDRFAYAQTLLRVWQIPSNVQLGPICGGPTVPGSPTHALAIQMGVARGGASSRGAFADTYYGSDGPQQVIGLASNRAYGCLDAGSPTDKHAFPPANGDGDTVTSLHIPVGAYYRLNDDLDAPIPFYEYYETPQCSGSWWETIIAFDSTSQHAHATGLKQGLWRLETKFPLYYNPPPPPPPPNSPGNATTTPPWLDQKTPSVDVKDPTTDPKDAATRCQGPYGGA